MKTSTCNLPAQPPNPCAALSIPRRGITPQPEVQLRTHCLVEFAVQSGRNGPLDGATDGDAPIGNEPGVVLLSIYVPRCSLHPNQVRIVEV
jgi:hypothetical protein